MRELMDDKLNEPIDVGVGGYLYMTCGKSRERSLAWACKRETLQLSLPRFTPSFSHRLLILEADVQQQLKSQF